MMNGPWLFIHPAEGFAEQELCTDTKISGRKKKKLGAEENKREKGVKKKMCVVEKNKRM